MTYLSTVAARVRALVPAAIVPPDSDDLFLLYALLVRAKGMATTAADVHDAWTAWMSISGASHPSMVPYADLPTTIKSEDEPFVVAIRAVALELS